METQDFIFRKEPQYTRIVINRPRLDTMLAPRLKSELVVLSGSGVSNIVLDLNNLQYCDSSGLSAILVANRLCRSGNGMLVLTGLSKEVERLITISQLDTVLSIAYNESQITDFFSEL